MIDSEQNECADHGADKPRALARLIPADGLTEISGNQGPYDAEYCCDDEAFRVAARHDDLGNEAGEEADDNGPENLHGRHSPTVAGGTVRQGNAVVIGRGRP